jgi:hypothetical protein
MSKLYEEYNTTQIITCLLWTCFCSYSVVLLIVFEEEIETVVVLSGLLITYVHSLVLLCELKYL